MGGSASAKLCDTVTDTFTVEQDKRVCVRASDRHSRRGDKIEIRALAQVSFTHGRIQLTNFIPSRDKCISAGVHSPRILTLR